MLSVEQLGLNVVQVGARNNHVCDVVNTGNLDSHRLVVLMQNLGHWRAGVNLNAVFLGKFCDCLNHRVKPTLRVENALVHVNVCHQVIHARGVVGRSS